MTDEKQKPLTEKRKNELINVLEKAKAMVAFVWDETDNNEVGDTMCSIDEAIASLESN